jgi:hypothetical protein
MPCAGCESSAEAADFELSMVAVRFARGTDISNGGGIEPGSQKPS